MDLQRLSNHVLQLVVEIGTARDGTMRLLQDKKVVALIQPIGNPNVMPILISIVAGKEGVGVPGYASHRVAAVERSNNHFTWRRTSGTAIPGSRAVGDTIGRLRTHLNVN